MKTFGLYVILVSMNVAYSFHAFVFSTCRRGGCRLNALSNTYLDSVSGRYARKIVSYLDSLSAKLPTAEDARKIISYLDSLSARSPTNTNARKIISYIDSLSTPDANARKIMSYLDSLSAWTPTDETTRNILSYLDSLSAMSPTHKNAAIRQEPLDTAVERDDAERKLQQEREMKQRDILKGRLGVLARATEGRVRRRELLLARQTAIMNARRQPKPLEEEKALSERYSSMGLEERAFSILIDLGMVQPSLDPEDPEYDHSSDNDFVS